MLLGLHTADTALGAPARLWCISTHAQRLRWLYQLRVLRPPVLVTFWCWSALSAWHPCMTPVDGGQAIDLMMFSHSAAT
jgi:hypothetical protein